MKYAKYLSGVAMSALAAGAAQAGGLWQTLPIVGGAAYCASTNVVGNAQGTITGTGGSPASNGQTTGTSICGSNVPAGEPALTGTEVLPLDLYTPGTQVYAGGPSTEVLPVTLLGAGYGSIVIDSTTGAQTVTIANGVSAFIYDGAGTAGISFILPSAPFQNEKLCIDNAASTTAALAVTVAANTTAGQVSTIIEGTAVSSLGLQIGNSSTAMTLASACYVYNAAATQWIRVL